MTVSLTNTAGRCQVFVLSHEAFCAAHGSCRCSLEPGRSGRRLPTSLTLVAGNTVSQLPDAVLAVPEVVRAVRRGELAVTRAAPERAASPEPDSTPAAPSGSSRSDVNKPTKKRGAG